MNHADETQLRLNAAVAALLHEPLDEAAVDRVQQRAVLLDAHTGEPRSRGFPSVAGKMRSRVRKAGSMAASAAVLLLFAVWFVVSPGAMAFSQIAERLIQVRSVQFSTRLQMHNDPVRAGKIMIQGNMFRLEQGPEQHRVVSLLNTATQEILHLDLSRRMAQESVRTETQGDLLVNPIAELVAARDKAVRSLGQDRIAGSVVDVYRIRGLQVLGVGENTEMTLWADPASQLPVRIEMRDVDPKHKMTLTFEDFQWNSIPNTDLFAMTVPDGFRSGIVFRTPHEAETEVPPAQATQNLAAGMLFSGRVPGRLEVDRKRGTITALLRDPEQLQGTARRSPHELRQWDIRTGKPRWTQPVGGAGDFAICSSKDLLATVEGQEIQLRRLSTGAIVRTWESSEVLGPVAFCHDGTRLAHGYIRWSNPPKSSPPTGGVEIWNTETGGLEHHVRDIAGVSFLQCSPTTDLLVVCSAQWQTRLYNVATGELEYSMNSGSRAAFSPDGKLLATISSQSPSRKTQGRVDIVDLASKKIVMSVETTAGKTDSWLLSMAFSPDGSQLAATDWNGSVTVWDVATGASVPGIASLPAGVHCVGFTSVNQLAIGCEDGTLRMVTIRE